MPLSDPAVADTWGAAIPVTPAEPATSPAEAEAEAAVQETTAAEAAAAAKAAAVAAAEEVEEAEAGEVEVEVVLEVVLVGSSAMEWSTGETSLEGAMVCLNPCSATPSQEEGGVVSRVPVAGRVIRREGTAQENNCKRPQTQDW